MTKNAFGGTKGKMQCQVQRILLQSGFDGEANIQLISDNVALRNHEANYK